MIMPDNDTIIDDNYNDVNTIMDLKRQFEEQIRAERKAYEDQQLKYHREIHQHIESYGPRSLRNYGKLFIISYDDMMKLCKLLNRTKETQL